MLVVVVVVVVVVVFVIVVVAAAVCCSGFAFIPNQDKARPPKLDSEGNIIVKNDVSERSGEEEKVQAGRKMEDGN